MEKRNKRKGILGLLALLFGSSSTTTVGTFGSIFASKALVSGLVLGVSTLLAGGVVYYNLSDTSDSTRMANASMYGSSQYRNSMDEFDYEQQAMLASADLNSTSTSLDYFKQQAKQENILGFAGDVYVSDDETAVAKADNSLQENYDLELGNLMAAQNANKADDVTAAMAAAASSASSGRASLSRRSLSGLGSLDSGGGGKVSYSRSAPTTEGFNSLKNKGGPVGAINRNNAVTGMGHQSALKGARNARLNGSLNSRTRLAQMRDAVAKAVPMQNVPASAQLASAWDGAYGPGSVPALDRLGANEGTGGLSQDGSVSAPSGGGYTNNNNSTPASESMAPDVDTDTEEGNPWDSLMKMAQILLGVAAVMLLLANLMGKSQIPWVKALAKIFAALAAAAGAAVVAIGLILGVKHGQWAAGLGMALAGGFICYAAIKALMGMMDEGAATEAAMSDQVKAPQTEGVNATDGVVENPTDVAKNLEAGGGTSSDATNASGGAAKGESSFADDIGKGLIQKAPEMLSGMGNGGGGAGGGNNTTINMPQQQTPPDLSRNVNDVQSAASGGTGGPKIAPSQAITDLASGTTGEQPVQWAGLDAKYQTPNFVDGTQGTTINVSNGSNMA